MTDHSYQANRDKFIGIIETGTGADCPRVSTLEITDAGLCVLGNLPHGYTFKPTNRAQRDALVTYLENLHFNADGEPVKPSELSATLSSIARGLNS